ncbi:EAL domain-containing response regulator [Leptothoe sp. PORK10 BA2]|uniref:EAL domain-containing response regulator n=1 Tax=Leptothoe sp. PORK10 BA2 TaxID=3110254 RepID=UPI002B1F69B4|nr:EAL domain-containing protein [Leptothoe sp. PORK10 BA2]MEA5464430.1 EAL domain-containing protein [Leptothoe sp. PORK10 BA2]
MTTILVIDDDTKLATFFCNALALNDFATLQAATGLEGMQLAQQHQPQLIVCNINLPDISGYDVLERLRSHTITTAIPVIMVTDHGTPETFRCSMAQGADDYLTKPIDLPDFLQAVRTQLTKREQLAQYFAQAFQTSPPASPASPIKSPYEQLTSPTNLTELEIQLEQLKQSPGSSLWVIQLRNYSDLCADYGHVLGQLVLQTMEQQLRQWQEREQDWGLDSALCLTLAYVGRDRFAVFFRASEPPTQADSKAAWDTAMVNLQTELQQPMVINNHRLVPDIHIEAMVHPDLAQLKTLDSSPIGAALDGPSLSLAERLRRAIQGDELQLYFQPQVDLSSGQIVGAEALVRWYTPEENQILPIQFIPVAEENGLMLPLGEWIIETALRQLTHWQKKQFSAISMALNLSSYQLRSSDFIHRLMAMVKATSISPVMIDLELPERLILEDLSQAKSLLAELSKRGFSPAIDDFSFSSLSHLPDLPVNILKLDKCFVRNLHQNTNNQVIVKAIMDIARSLNISTIANGVETARELSVLKQLKCHSMQGYLFSPALSAQDFETLLLESTKRSPNRRPGLPHPRPLTMGVTSR